MSIDVKQFSAAQVAQDAIYFRYLVQEADPRKLVQMLGSDATIHDWRDAIAKMMEADRVGH